MTVEQPIVRPPEPVRHKITVAEFLALDEAGFFEDRRVELIDGEIYEMAPLHRPRARVTVALSAAMHAAVKAHGQPLETLAEPSAELEVNSLPQPDIVVADIVDEKLVTAPSVRLLVEVSSASMEHDLGRKLQLYARTGVPEYWIADVNGREIIRFHAPQGEAYGERTALPFGEPVPSATIAGLTVDTSDLA